MYLKRKKSTTKAFVFAWSRPLWTEWHLKYLQVSLPHLTFHWEKSVTTIASIIGKM
jgi:hypothetical protein